LGVLNSQLFFGSYSIFINESPRDYFGKQALEVSKQVLDKTLTEKTIIVPSTLVTKENVDQLKTKD